ncbi:SDR family oxidoreductase [Cryobacterium melibiosiphilum]|uniref:SDR family oxidoreductase n=1 Tax=Cryobacterium melibiosiphilum TaxID=995039 RepID=A0A3A5MBI0_9MICO|nr:SDR family oxidoreductase [Cryobacterium melibiosiphilum]RJT85699.1 SDR family oxidoreductase [Cryobacterium melibiosiphilum]
MSIVVTGATGHLGALIIDHLISRGISAAEITGVGRNADRLAALSATGVHTATVDYSDAASLATALAGAGADTLVLVSGSEVGQRVQQHTNVINAAKAAGVTRIVYTSAPKADTSALILAPEHKATEELIRASGIPFTILRNGWYTENYQNVVAVARQSGTYLTSAGTGRVSSASRTDYAEAVAAVLTSPGHEGKTYELSGDVAWDGTEMATALTTLLGQPVVFTSVSPEQHAGILQNAGLDEGTVGFVVALDGNIRDGLLDGTSGELATLIGRPTTPLLDGLHAA